MELLTSYQNYISETKPGPAFFSHALGHIKHFDWSKFSVLYRVVSKPDSRTVLWTHQKRSKEQHVYVYVYTYNMYMYMHIHMCIYMYVYMYMYIHMYVYVYLYTL